MLILVVLFVVALLVAARIAARYEVGFNFPTPAERKSHASNWQQFRLRHWKGQAVAVRYSARSWWADVVGAWREVLGASPTFASDFPILAHLMAAGRWFLRSPRAQLVALVLALQFVGRNVEALAVVGPIRHLRSYAPMASLTVTPATDMGKKLLIPIRNGRANRYLQVALQYSFDIATADGTAIRNFGLPEAVIEEIGITGGGDGDTHSMPGLVAAFASEFQLNASAGSKTRLTSFAIGTTSMQTLFRLWMENPRSGIPRETVYLEKIAGQDLSVFVKFSNKTTGAATSHQGAGALLTGAATTVATFVTMSVRVEQIAATGAIDLPLFRPQTSTLSRNVPGLNSRFEVQIPGGQNEYLRGLTIMFTTDTDLASMISTTDGIGLRGDNFEYLGEGQLVSANDYGRGSSNYETGASLYDLYGLKMFHYDFQQDGRLSNIYNPTQDSNLRFVLNITVAPANAQVVVVKHSLIRDKWVGPGPDFRRVVAEALPDGLKDA